MAEFENVIFGDEGLYKAVKTYSRQRRITFSRAVQELSAGGLLLYRETSNIPPFRTLEGLKKTVNFLESRKEEK